MHTNYVEHYDAYNAVKNVSEYYKNSLMTVDDYGASLKLIKNGDKYVEDQLGILERKAEEYDNPIKCPYCGESMHIEICSNHYSGYTRFRPSGDYIHFKCWRCKATSPEIKLIASLLNQQEVSKAIAREVALAKREIERELSGEDDYVDEEEDEVDD